MLIVLSAGVLVLLFSSIFGEPVWDWKKTTFVICAGFSLFIALTVPDHFFK